MGFRDTATTLQYHCQEPLRAELVRPWHCHGTAMAFHGPPIGHFRGPATNLSWHCHNTSYHFMTLPWHCRHDIPFHSRALHVYGPARSRCGLPWHRHRYCLHYQGLSWSAMTAAMGFHGPVKALSWHLSWHCPHGHSITLHDTP